MTEQLGEIRYTGRIDVRPYRRGTYLGDDHLETLIEQTLRDHYSFGEGWRGLAEVSITLYEQAVGVEASERAAGDVA